MALDERRDVRVVRSGENVCLWTQRWGNRPARSPLSRRPMTIGRFALSDQ
jgi:hypothetical protein